MLSQEFITCNSFFTVNLYFRSLCRQAIFFASREGVDGRRGYLKLSELYLDSAYIHRRMCLYIEYRYICSLAAMSRLIHFQNVNPKEIAFFQHPDNLL